MSLNANTATVSQFKLSKITLKNLKQFNICPTAKLVLLALVDCYNQKNKIFPKQKTISEWLGISERSVQRAIKELAKEGLIFYTCKNQNNYKLTAKIFELDKLSYSTRQIDVRRPDKLSHACINIKEEHKKNIISLPFKSKFQEEYAEVFERLSEYDLKKYKSLKGYEKEDWLKGKRSEINRLKNKEIELATKEKEQKREYILLTEIHKSREEALEFLKPFKNLPFVLNNESNFKIMQKWNISIEDLK